MAKIKGKYVTVTYDESVEFKEFEQVIGRVATYDECVEMMKIFEISFKELSKKLPCDVTYEKDL